MTKAEARKLIDSLNLSPSQTAAARHTLNRTTNAENVEIVKTDGGDLIIKRSRPGKVFGYQVYRGYNQGRR